MTNISIPLHLFVKFKDLHGEALAQAYFDVYDKSLQILNEEVKKETLYRKAELKDEFLHELVTKGEFKAEIKEVRVEIKELRAELNEFKAETKAEFKELRAELNEFKAETKAEFKVLRAELNEFKAETKAEFKVLKFSNYTIIALLLIFIGTSNPTFVELIKALLK
jgi:DNA repair exonuclease SbcCD ATPase subunit